MKRTLSLILALLMLASSMTACRTGESKETEKPNDTAVTETKESETDSPATNAPETNAPETDAPAPIFPYDTSLITENGVAKAHIVLAENADSVLTIGANDLQYHIKKVTGADMTVTNTVQSDSLPIIIATPDTMPELEELFPDDLSWLRDTGEDRDTDRWGDDGFAIRAYDGKVYIFGANPRGALNGVYDFIEENLGVLWIRSYEDQGLIYDEMPTVTLEAVNYREKSPFSVRFWVAGGFGGENTDQFNLFISRNKLNSSYESIGSTYQWQHVSEQGMRPFITCHNVKNLIIQSPIYDPNIDEYWDTDDAGNHVGYERSGHANFWSELTADTVAASVLNYLDTYTPTVDIKYFGVNLEDWGLGNVFPEDTLPFEYLPGEFVTPADADYLSTVFYTFLNRVARQVKEKYPDITITTFAYSIAQSPPRCELEDNIALVFAPLSEELAHSLFDSDNFENRTIYNYLETWKTKTRNINFYNYYGTFVPSVRYERPIWDRIQEHFLYYKENGFTGVMSEGIVDYDQTHIWDTGSGHTPLTQYQSHPDGSRYLCSDTWKMNTLSFWLYHKLAWNPEEDTDALIEYFCDKVYKDASPHMQDYYRIIDEAWKEGAETIPTLFNVHLYWNKGLEVYLDHMLFCTSFGSERDYMTEALDALNKALEAADDTVKERIRYIKEAHEQNVVEFEYY